MKTVLVYSCCQTPHLTQCACPTCGRRIYEGDFLPLDTLPSALQEAHAKGWR